MTSYGNATPKEAPDLLDPMRPIDANSSAYVALSPGSTINETPYRRQSCWRRNAWALCCGGVFVVLVAAIVTGGVIASRDYAKAAIRDADITMDMSISVGMSDTVVATIVGEVDNRAVVGGTLEASTLQVMYKGGSIGNVAFPEIELTGGSSTSLNITSEIAVSDMTAFSAFASAALNTKRVVVQLQGTLTVKTFGVSFHDIPLTKDITLNGFNGFSYPPPVIDDVTIFKGEPQTLFMAVTATIPNLSSLALENAGILTVNALVEGVSLGIATSTEDVSFQFGDNVITWDVQLQRTPENAHIINQVVSNYSSGLLTYLTLHGTKSSSNHPLLQEPLSKLAIHTAIPGLVHGENKLLQLAYGLLNVTKIFGDPDPACPPPFHISQEVYLSALNEHNVTMQITSSNVTVGWHGDKRDLSQYPYGDVAYSHVPTQDVVVNATSTTVFSATLCVSMSTFRELSDVLRYATHELHADTSGVVPFNLDFYVYGKLMGTLGDFADVELTYTQEHVLGELQLLQVQSS